jgi:hypothetical protein
LLRVKVRERIAKTQIAPRIHKEKWDVEKLGSVPRNQYREEYQQLVKVKLRMGNKGGEEVEEELDMEEQWKKIKQAIKEAAEETIQEEKPARKENCFDEECAQFTARKNMAWQKMLEKETPANTERYQELRREANGI